jgi:hypothetical protein
MPDQEGAEVYEPRADRQPKTGFQRKLREVSSKKLNVMKPKSAWIQVSQPRHLSETRRNVDTFSSDRALSSLNFSSILTISAQINFGRSFARWLGTVDAGAAAGDDQSCGSYAAHLNQSELG